MFEDSTFESMGRIRTRSRGWMIAAFILNGSILLAMVLIPLIYPQALPRIGLAYLMEAPAPPVQQPRQQPPPANATVVQPQMQNGRIFAPPQIPIGVPKPAGPEVLARIDLGTMGDGPGGPVGADNPWGKSTVRPDVRPAPSGPVHLTSTIAAGLLIYKPTPVYPAIAKAAGREGTVVLQATISTNGTIKDLHVVSGNPMLQQAALDAVKNWRYRPYQLNGQAIEVETTVNVVFTLAH